jgi:dihydroneopterin triphosphate diphosphatase
LLRAVEQNKGEGMFPIITDGIAVYVYRLIDRRYQFLQLLRADEDEFHGQTWQPVYGGAQAGETAVQAARREMSEETGLAAVQMFLVDHVETFYFRPTNSIQMLPVFAGLVDASAEVILNEEHSDSRWVDESEVNNKFVWGSQRLALAAVLELLHQYPDRIPLLIV